MYVYWLLFALFAIPALAVLPRPGRRSANLFLPMAAVIMAAIVGMRYEVGADWEPYLYIFDMVRRTNYVALLDRGDIGFYTILWAAQRAGFEVWAPNLVCACIFTVGLFAFARRQLSPWLTVAVAVPYLVLVIAMSATRQATAIGFIFLALVAFYDGKLWRAGFWTFCASLFHASSILMLGIAALSYTRNRFQSFLLILALALPAYYLLSSNIETYVERYSGPGIQSSGAMLRVLMNLIPAAIYLFFSRHFPDPPHVRTLWRNLSWLAVACVPLLFLLPSSTAVDRLALYAIPLQMYVLSRLPVAVAPNLHLYRTWTVGIIAYLALVQLVFLTYSAHRDLWDPYKFYPLFGESSTSIRAGNR